MLVGAVLIIGFMVRLLNTSEAPVYPLSGAPVGEGEAPVVVTQPATRVATGSLSAQMPMNQAGERLSVGPAAFPPGAAVVLSAVLPTDEVTTIRIGLSRLADDGTLQSAAAVAVEVDPDANGMARVSTSVGALTAELGPGIYQVRLVWDGRQIGGADVALGLYQPSTVAIFDEPRRVAIAAGSYTGVRMDARGAVVDERPFTLGTASGAPAAAFAYFGATPHVLITEGVWAGYWLPLSDAIAFV